MGGPGAVAKRAIGEIGKDVAEGGGRVVGRVERQEAQAVAKAADGTVVEGVVKDGAKQGLKEASPNAAVDGFLTALKRQPGFLNAAHEANANKLKLLKSTLEKTSGGERIGLQAEIAGLERKIAIDAAKVELDLATKAVGAITSDTTEAVKREAYRALGARSKKYADALIADGQQDAAIPFLKTGAKAFSDASTLAKPRPGSGSHLVDLSAAVLMAGRAGDSEIALGALRNSGTSMLTEAVTLLRRSDSLVGIEKQNAEKVALAIVNDVRAGQRKQPIKEWTQATLDAARNRSTLPGDVHPEFLK